MPIRALVPAHLAEPIAAALSPGRAILVPYDREGVPLADSAGSVALFRWWLTPEQGDRLLETHPRLAWIHSGSAGVDHILTPRFRERVPLLTNSAGVHAPSIAEWVVAAMLSVVKDLPEMARLQRERRFESVQRPELTGRKVVLIGAGRIATEIARRLAPFGVRLTAVRRAVAPHEIIPEIVAANRLAETCRDADWLMVTAPLTAETRGIVGAEVLAALPSSARLFNVARGELVDEDALLAALRSGRIAGAILDVFREEPLPPDHPFWSDPRVVVFPHTTWRSPDVKRRQVELFASNLERFARGEPLANLVDPARGY